MKRFITLNESDGYGEECRCRREKVSGRLELLKALFDGDPFWMVRIRASKQADRNYLKLYGNGHWRFLDHDDAKTKFKELTELPKYTLEAKRAGEKRELSRKRMLDAQQSGKMPSFKKPREN